MLVGMAEVNTASNQSKVNLYAPKWCCLLAKWLLKAKSSAEQRTPKAIAPKSTKDEHGKKIHYDSLRASVILAVSATVIAAASGLGLPVSTTYVTFAAVIATGFADQVFTKGSSELKIGRAIWVLFSWISSGFAAFAITALMARLLFTLEIYGIIVAVSLNIALWFLFKKKADNHEQTYHK